ncbi:DEAD/DEAH box helicase [Treponema zuelzerae]|uniref:DEAD/DEAH box helicase n=1 Tax=Teretinema zuelzerae TaxID=156 RepID=A0AAE3JKP3_9SPIR|nr:SNF2-related protein [Teretinema zuelzerae]MCD1654119.1 DEAD/DEAH box helicase [Teretinema zuelzerae]
MMQDELSNSLQNFSQLMPFVRGDRVLDKFDNRIGLITGKCKGSGDSVRWEVSFSEFERSFLLQSFLEKVPETDDLVELFQKGRFGGVTDLRRLILHIRLKGQLTNIFYSMHNGTTDFMAHQFKPVMKFIESTTGRLLIADEVGLGKTIEAIYIWKELQARENARRMLIVCPAALREKWRNDLLNYFAIKAEIIDVKKLLEIVKTASSNHNQENFVCITSLEGIRYKEREDYIEVKNPRSQLYWLLDELASGQREEILDLVVIDEAHYLRNSNTASFKTATRVRDNTKSLVLLSATPIQTSEDNLFNLLQLLSPDEFFDKPTFIELLSENRILVEIANKIRTARDIEDFYNDFEELNQSFFFRDDTYLQQLIGKLPEILANPDLRIQSNNQLQNKYFYSPFVSRTRKRDAFKESTTRVPKTLEYMLSDYELGIYQKVSMDLREKGKAKGSFSQFSLIARQRQMASCLPAAFMHWKDNEQMEDILWEDIGIITEDEDSEFTVKKTISVAIDDINIEILRKNDSKYAELRKGMRELLKKDPSVKIVLFSFYRRTIEYLYKRLNEDEISSVYIMGGMGDEKNEIIERFKNSPGLNVLISSEVGSEGIDLQFASIEFNYDLPWNPMRLEQRIGRIDRIGQKSEKILIYNMICSNTVEDRVLQRLYDRIDIFTSSIGDIEEILGEKISELAIELMNSELTDEERIARANRTIDAIASAKQTIEELEKKAEGSIAFKDFILENIDESARNNRFISSRDLEAYIDDFFQRYYPGSRIRPHSVPDTRLINLSADAKYDLTSFLEQNNLRGMTNLGHEIADVLCLFESKTREKVRRNAYEIIDINHPLVRWISTKTESTGFTQFCCSALNLQNEAKYQIHSGVFVYCIQQWDTKGYKDTKELKYWLCDIETKELIDLSRSELIITSALYDGTDYQNWSEDLSEYEQVLEAMELAQNSACDSFTEFEHKYFAENEAMCEKQRNYINMTTNRKIQSIEKLILQMQENQRSERMIKLNQSKIVKAQNTRTFQLRRLEENQKARCSLQDIGVGIIKIY